MAREQSFTIDLFNRFNYIDRIIRTQPYILGGSSGSDGGGGTPPGGFIGQLPQRQVAGDTTESFLFTSGSIGTIIDNLNNIRAWLLPAHNFWAETNESNNLYISSGSWYYQNQTAPLIFTGGYSPAIVNPTTNDRLALLYTNRAGVMDWVYGSESLSPPLPDFPDHTSGSLPLWVVYTRPGATTIERYDNGGNYIYGDYRPFINSIGWGAPESSGSSLYQWYADGPLSTGSGIDGVYFTPQATTAKGVDLYLDTVGTSGSTIVDLQYSSDGFTWTSLFLSNPLPTLTPSQVLASFPSDNTIIPISNVIRANITSAGDGAKSLSVNFRGEFNSITSSSGSSSTTTQRGQAIFTQDLNLNLAEGALRLRNRLDRTLTIQSVSAEVGTAPGGAGVVVDINNNGTTIFTTQSNRPTIESGVNFGETTAIDIPQWFSGDYLTMDIDQIGISPVGSDLVVTVVYL